MIIIKVMKKIECKVIVNKNLINNIIKRNVMQVKSMEELR